MNIAASAAIKSNVPVAVFSMEMSDLQLVLRLFSSLGQIGQHITAEHPDFDARTYGKRKLSDLVRELKRFETRKDGNQLMVRRVD